MSYLDKLKPVTGVNKENTKVEEKTSKSKSYLSKLQPVGEEVQTEQPEKKDGFVKSLVKAPLTMIARPFQATAQLLGASPEAVDKFSKEKLGGYVAPVPQNFGDVKKDLGRAAQTVALGMPGLASGGATFGAGMSLEQGNDLLSKESALSVAGGAVGGKLLGFLGKPLLDVTGKVIGKITPQIIKDVTSKGAGAVEQFMAQHEILPKGASNLINKGVETAENIANKPFDMTGNLAKRMTEKSEQQIQANILSKYEKGVKPLLSGKTTPSTLEKSRQNILEGVDTIKQNKANLKFNDADGMEVLGETPKTLQQFTDSIEQTKKSVFTKYDTLAKQAGEAGIKIKTRPIASELDTVINNKALQLTNPKAVTYAKAAQLRYKNIGNLDATTAQEVIQNYNKSLEAFYRNPSYDNASQAAIDAMIANNMRTALDEGITGLTGSQYGALKRQYGALKSIEKDVIKATLRDARKNTKGLIDFTDILSGGQVINGILSLNPAQIGSGIAQKGIATFYKYLNNPNRAIEKMFLSAESLPQSNLLQNFQKATAPILNNNTKNIIPKL